MACVFQCLSRPGRPALDQALSVFEKAKALNSTRVQSELYDRAKMFFEQFRRIDSTTARQQDGEMGPKMMSKEVEAFSIRLFDILFGPKTSEAEPESTRMKRAVLAVAYAKCAAASETGRLTTTLQRWLDTERSGPLRETIKRALLVINTSVSINGPRD